MIKITFLAKPLGSNKPQRYEFMLSSSKEFLLTLDKFLKKSKINKSSLTHCLAVFQDEGFISQRIVSTVLKTINLLTSSDCNF